MTIKLITHEDDMEKEYTVEELETLRNNLIELRDGAIAQADFHWSVVLSHTIKVLAVIMEQMK